MDVEFVRHQFQDGHDGVVVKNKFKLGVRHVQILYMFVCGATFGAVRGSNGVALLALTDHQRDNETYIQIRQWDRRIQGTVLSFFFIGYALMLLPAELLLRRLSGKYVLTAALLASGALSVAMPTIVNKGGRVSMSNAFLWMGSASACFTPCNQALLAKWLPPDERNIFSWVVNLGTLIGTIVSMPISGLIQESHLGWELIFYAQAMLTLSMGAVWGLLTASSPEQHQAVGDGEKEFIRETQVRYRKKPLPVPWLSILKSPPVWGVACAHAASNAVFVFCLTETPAYLRLFGVSLRNVSWQSVLPLCALWVFRASTAPTVDWLCRSLSAGFRLNLTYLRKFINILGACGVVAGLTFIPSISSAWPPITVLLLTLVMGAVGFQFSGFLETHKDLSENYPESLLIMTSVFASAVGAAVPALTGLVVGDDSSPSAINRYHIVFVSLAGFYVICNLIYTVVATSDRQFWDTPTSRTKFGYHNTIIDPNHVEMDELTNTKQRQGNLVDEYAI